MNEDDVTLFTVLSGLWYLGTFEKYLLMPFSTMSWLAFLVAVIMLLALVELWWLVVLVEH